MDSARFRTLWMVGCVSIEAKLPFNETAELLAKVLAVSFLEDIEGNYEEFPAFTAAAAGLEFVLLGIPLAEECSDGEAIETYELQVQSDLVPFPDSQIEAERFHAVELSEFFSRLIHAKTGLECTARELPGAA